MSLFSKILDKLGLRKDKEEEKVEEKQQPAARGTAGASASMPRKPAATSPNPKTTAPARPSGPAPTSERGVRTPASTADRRQSDDMAVKHDPAPVPAAAPKPMAAVDVTNMLEQKAKGTGLNWKQSISDLLFLLDIDNSYNARVELAKELNAPQEVMGDSARMNTWLHKEVLRRIAENGGNIPQDLLD
ncbi:MAG TPA: DUF3597 domain-containing protein [Anaerolineales bacterium]|nr:DUF3597 domain-containing protein [Anaerolineales bacterium]